MEQVRRRKWTAENEIIDGHPVSPSGKPTKANDLEE